MFSTLFSLLIVSFPQNFIPRGRGEGGAYIFQQAKSIRWSILSEKPEMTNLASVFLEMKNSDTFFCFSSGFLVSNMDLMLASELRFSLLCCK
jgi:hypothetical protein